jgi:hypothetical protein
VRHEIDDLQVGSAPWSEDRTRDFEAWVGGRLADWTTTEMRAFERWLLDESEFEFIPAVRAALRQKRLEESDRFGSGEPATDERRRRGDGPTAR